MPRAGRRSRLPTISRKPTKTRRRAIARKTSVCLYVALTRARDRLYLSVTVQEGVCRMGRGSLGEVLPASMRPLFVSAVPGDEPREVTCGLDRPAGRTVLSCRGVLKE